MNIILFTREEIVRASLPADDRRALHINQVLSLKVGDSFIMGVCDGEHGEGRLRRRDPDGALHFDFALGAASPALYPVTLLVGLPRPQMARRIMRDATTLGVSRIVFFTSERGSKSYAQSPVFTRGHIRELLQEGAEQAVSTRCPEVLLAAHLREGLEMAHSPATLLLACDNEEASMSLASYAKSLAPAQRGSKHIIVVIGAERGFSHAERAFLRARDCTLLSLGTRILRTDTAALTALGLVLAGSGFLA